MLADQLGDVVTALAIVGLAILALRVFLQRGGLAGLGKLSRPGARHIQMIESRPTVKEAAVMRSLILSVTCLP